MTTDKEGVEMQTQQVTIPDLGGAETVEVIEVLVKPGDQIQIEDGLVTLESDKASMDVPSPFAGTVKEVLLKVGDQTTEGAAVVTLEVGDAKSEAESSETLPESTQAVASQVVDVTVPDIGGEVDAEVIEIAVKPGDVVNVEDALITLESDKASMDVPAPYAGTIIDLHLKVGDKASEGTKVLSMEVVADKEIAEGQTQETPSAKVQVEEPQPPVKATDTPKVVGTGATDASLYASPAVRRIASEFDIPLTQVPATGDKGRITKEDIQRYVKTRMAGGGSVATPMPAIDFSQFGETETKPLNKIKRLTGENLSRNWATIPHVTQFDEVDITELEAFRKQNKSLAEKAGYKLTPLVFIMKAVVAALKQFPAFNSSLAPNGAELIYKQYYHVGIAVDTPDGLVVPVVRDVDTKGALALAKELSDISIKARDKKLMPRDMQGGCMTISSLGGIGGTAFTPIVNAPEVAILGVSRAQTKPVYVNGELSPRLMLPLSLSYDHRVIDGADGARFITYLNKALSDLKYLTL